MNHDSLAMKWFALIEFLLLLFSVENNNFM